MRKKCGVAIKSLRQNLCAHNSELSMRRFARTDTSRNLNPKTVSLDQSLWGSSFPPLPNAHSRFPRTPESASMQFRVSVCGFLRHCSIERQLSEHTVRAYANDLADVRKFVGAGVAPAEISAVTLTA